MQFKRSATCYAFASLITFGLISSASYAGPEDTTPSVRSALTFPGNRVIYIGAGVFDSGDGPDAGTATTVSCTNASNSTANVVVRFFNQNNVKVGEGSTSLPARNSETMSTHGTFLSELLLGTGAIFRGRVVVLSNQSAVFCTAAVVNAAGPAGGYALHLVRYRKHSGTEE